MTVAVSTGDQFGPGDRVRVIDGLFQQLEGAVESVWKLRRKVKVQLVIFGRDTPVEVDENQLEKTD